MSEEMGHAQEMESLCKELERHGLQPISTDWECPDSRYAYPSGSVNLRFLVQVLNQWEAHGKEWDEMMEIVDDNLTRMTRLLEDVRTGRRTPDSLPPLGVNLTRPTPRSVPHTAAQAPVRIRTQWGTPSRRRLKTTLDFVGDMTKDITDFFKSD